MSQWFRFYGDALNNPKVQKLPGDLFKTWVNILCVASQNDGALPAISDLAFLLRVKETALQTDIRSLIDARLIDEDETGLHPHKWEERQFKSDVSKERVKRHRERQRNVTGTVTVTPPEQIQSRTETEQTPRGELDEIEDRCREAAGLENDPSPSLLDISPIVGLTRKGYDLSADILPVLRTFKGKGKPAKSWRYFVPAIEESKAKNQAIKPNERDKPGEPVTWLSMDDPLWKGVAERYREAKGKPPIHYAGRGGMGFHFPTDMVLEIPRELRREPAPLSG